MEENNNEPIQMFNNGCIYYAHTIDDSGGARPPEEIGFRALTFYEEFSGQNIIADFRASNDAQPYIRTLVDKETPFEEMQQRCFDSLVSVLRKDVAKSWYADKVFIPGKQHNESVQEHLKRNPDFRINPYVLRLENCILIKK